MVWPPPPIKNPGYVYGGSYREVKLLEHGMKIIERELERRIIALVDFDEAQFGFVPRYLLVAQKPISNVPITLITAANFPCFCISEQ